MTLNNRKLSRSNSDKPIILQTVRQLVSNFFEHDVGKNAAALAYYLMFAIFPLLVFLSNLLGLLNLDIAAIIQSLQQILPKDIVSLIESYLAHVSNTSSHTLLWFALVFSVWFPLQAVRGLMNDVRLAYHLKKPKLPVRYFFSQVIYTVVFLIVIVLTALLTIMGRNVLSFIFTLLPENTLELPVFILNLWQYLRFLPVALLMFFALGALYALSMDERQPIRTILPGITAALVSWLAVSVIFSFYVENFADYSIIYGTLGSVIMLMMWLYLSALILILGAELNAVLKAARDNKNKE